ncbi:MAG: hypothetical protein ACI9W2_000149 [Gammaproteobacteria bacterium]|jgi:hypothetical protein
MPQAGPNRRQRPMKILKRLLNFLSPESVDENPPSWLGRAIRLMANDRLARRERKRRRRPTIGISVKMPV